MALNAFHIRARSDPPPPSSSHRATLENGPRSRPGLAPGRGRQGHPEMGDGEDQGPSFSSHHNEEARRWIAYRTGPIHDPKLSRKEPIRFVKATGLSDPSLRPAEERGKEKEEEVQGQQDEVAPDKTSLIAGKESKHEETSSPNLQSMASFYASLTRDLRCQGSKATESSSSTSREAPLQPPPPPPLSAVPCQLGSHRASTGPSKLRSPSSYQPFAQHLIDKWRSIQRGSGKERDREGRGETEAGPAHLSFQEGRCPECGDILPSPCSNQEFQDHRKTISHRLGKAVVLASPEDSSRQPSSDSSTSTALSIHDRTLTLRGESNPGPTERLSIQPGNVGYALLQRMGWSEGMGLGTSEWAWMKARRRRKRQGGGSEDSERRRGLVLADSTLSLSTTKGQGNGIIDLTSEAENDEEGDKDGKEGKIHEGVIVISDDSQSEGEGDERGTEGVETRAYNWMSLLPAGKDDESIFGGGGVDLKPEEVATAASPSPSSPHAEKETGQCESDSTLEIRKRPNLVPIPVTFKNDKRGLGIKTRRTGVSHVMRKARVDGGVEEQASESSGSREEARMTKKRRRDEHERERREWLALRESLM
ncbi:hypothetical protein IE53DRAFT_368040 [Violaceomyces palustris]|uniref:Uncharacterized protein n=1 Tax=Violaceomyces palustris TaxID=1673888 RepID=A0ACD0P0A7_9BASI|nr:hypothetical protein IE53DRAFT_368040 [Violaceomyces palustris]